MSTKVNANAQAIVDSIDKFIIGETYTYKQICQLCEMNETTGNAKIKQINTLKALLNIDEAKVGRATAYTIVAVKELNDEQLASIVANNRGKSEGSRCNNDIYSSKLNSNLVNSLRRKKNYYTNDYDEERDNPYFWDNKSIGEMHSHEYEHYVETKPYDVLSDNDTIVFNLYRNQIIESMGIRNDNNVKVYTNTPNYFCEYNGINPYVAKTVFPTINKATYRAFESQIKKFKSEGLGVISKKLEITVISEYDETGYPLDLTDEDDLAIYEYNKKYRITMKTVADEDIKDQFDLIKIDVAKEFYYRTPQDLYTRADKETKDKFHKRVQEVIKDKLGILSYRPFIRITTSLSMLEKHHSKFGYDEGLIAFTGQILKAIKGNIDLYTDDEARQKRFKKKLDKNIDNPKIYYDLVQQEEYFIPQATKFVDLMLNPCAKETPKIDNDIEQQIVCGGSKIIFSYKPTETTANDDYDYEGEIGSELSDEEFYSLIGV